jgi:ribosome-associated toxin RatA of RatAB toxin-antitoxin module
MTSMAETASETITIDAPPARVWEIAADVERYPEWVRDVKDVVVRSRDEQQRPAEVEFRASALGRSTHYTLAYDYSQAPDVLAWKMVKGDIQRSIEGAYHLTATADGGTEVRYDLAIELAAPLPGFVKRRAEVRILNSVRELKTRAETQ